MSYRSRRNKDTNGGKRYKVQGFTLNPESIRQKKDILSLLGSWLFGGIQSLKWQMGVKIP